MRRISWPRVDSDSVPNCWTMRRSADWRRSGSCSLFAPKGAKERRRMCRRRGCQQSEQYGAANHQRLTVQLRRTLDGDDRSVGSCGLIRSGHSILAWVAQAILPACRQAGLCRKLLSAVSSRCEETLAALGWFWWDRPAYRRLQPVLLRSLSAMWRESQDRRIAA